MTRLEYLDDNALGGTARIVEVAEGDSGTWVRLDRTWFHPQGGGQRSDVGDLSGVRVLRVSFREDGDVLHYLDTPPGWQPGDEVALTIDPAIRMKHARLHTGGHLLAGVAETLIPGLRAVAGHHWPGEARVDFTGLTISDLARLPTILTAEIAREISGAAPVRTIVLGDGERGIQIGDLPPIRCGGTHLVSLDQLGAMTVRNAKMKGGQLRVGYDVADDRF
jgi:alanyl-tRNA synthetase